MEWLEWLYFSFIGIIFYAIFGAIILEYYEKHNIFIIKNVNKTGWYVFGFPVVIFYVIFIKPLVKEKIETKNLSIREIRKAKLKKLNKHFWLW